MKRKGFTLIELLVVIVVLAIIALITIPMILGVIEKAKWGAFQDNVYGLMESTNVYIAQHLESETARFTCDGTKCQTKDEDKLSFKGKIPISGDILIDDKQQTKVEYITDGVYCAYGTINKLIIDKGCSNIDITEPEIDESKLILSSTTNSIQLRLLDGFAKDPESGIKKYRITINGQTKESEQIGEFTFKDLLKNKEYEITIEVTNGKNLKSVVVKKVKTLEIVNPSITLHNTPTTSINGYLKNQVADIHYNNDGTPLEFYVKTTRQGVSSIAVSSICGTEAMPERCLDTDNTTTLTPNTWYKVSGNIKVTYMTASSTTDTIYAYISDGVNESGTSTATISKIDATSPSLTLETAVSKTDSIVIPIKASDLETGINTPTCKYGTTNGNYTTDATSVSTTACSIKNIKENMNYYYQICVTDKVGNNICKTGSSKTIAITNPSITLTNTPETASNGYLKNQVANISYNGSGVSNPEHYLKTTKSAIGNVSGIPCGTGATPQTCGGSTTTNYEANTWYKVSENVNITYNTYADTTATLYAITYDGTNYSGATTATISKITKQTNYQVRHYLMDLNGTSYTLKDVDNLTGFAYYSVTPSLKSYTGFTAPATKTVTLAADGSTTIDYYYTRKQYYLDLNGYLDNTINGAIGGYGTADVYINGTIVANDVADFNQPIYYGSSYSITDIRAASGHIYNGVYSGTLSGNISGTTSVFLSFSTTYTVSYNANGGSGAPASQTKIYGKNLTLSSSVPTRSGWNFVGWNTSNTATSAGYGAGGTYTSNAGATLYAIWSKTITLSFNENGTTSGTAPASITKTVYNGNSATFKIPTATPYLNDAGIGTMQFNRWITSQYFNSPDYTTGYKPGSNITLSSDLTLYGSYIVYPEKSGKFYMDTNLNSAISLYSISRMDGTVIGGSYYSNWGRGVDDSDGTKRVYIRINAYTPFTCQNSNISIMAKNSSDVLSTPSICKQHGVNTSVMYYYLRRRKMYD